MNLHKPLVIAAATALLAGAASGAQADAVSPNQTYQFAGTCSDCSGTATASLTLQGYTPDTPLNNNDFVSFTYDGTNMLQPYTLTNVLDLEGSIGTSPGYYNVSISGYGSEGSYYFDTTSTGSWSTGPLDSADMGGQGTWNNGSTPISATPEPATWFLMFAGIAGIGFFLRQAKKVPGFRFRDCFAS